MRLGKESTGTTEVQELKILFQKIEDEQIDQDS